MTAGLSSGAAGGQASIVAGMSEASRGGNLVLVSGQGYTSGRGVTIDCGVGDTALGGFNRNFIWLWHCTSKSLNIIPTYISIITFYKSS